MKTWKSILVFLLCALSISGCSTADGTAQSESSTIPLFVYNDENSGIELQYPSNAVGEYRIICEEQETLWELGALPEDLGDIQIQPWGADGTFMILTAGLKGGTEGSFILNREMMSEVFIQDPYAMAEGSLNDSLTEEDNILFLGENGFCIVCEDSEALTMLKKNLWVSDEISYDVEEGSYICCFPVCIGPDDEIGKMCLYYEYDGVGMNCTDARFIPA